MEIRKTKLLRWQTVSIIDLPLLIFASYGMLARLPDLRWCVPDCVGLCAVITILLSVVLYAGRSMQTGWSRGFIVALADFFRAMFLLQPPELSDDIYRYLFDGLIFLSGHTPYAVAPIEVLTENNSLRTSDFIPYTGYPYNIHLQIFDRLTIESGCTLV